VYIHYIDEHLYYNIIIYYSRPTPLLFTCCSPLLQSTNNNREPAPKFRKWLIKCSSSHLVLPASSNALQSYPSIHMYINKHWHTNDISVGIYLGSWWLWVAYLYHTNDFRCTYTIQYKYHKNRNQRSNRGDKS